MVESILDSTQKKKIAESILSRLPEWFGIPESTAQYVEKCADMPFFAYYSDGRPVGFIALNETGKFTAEIYVMGVLKEYHRKGVGVALWDAFLSFARQHGYEYAQVKTVKMGCYEEYDATNAFYAALGFKELECFPTLWDGHNPCQVYVQYIAKNNT